MGFWGVEVRPSEPVTLSCRKDERGVRITQATLGAGGAIEKCLVQCTVGRRSPIFLCALLPNKAESCPLELEFEEADEVIFSVIGPRSVHLSGYYVQHNQPPYPHTDTKSCGIDIENAELEKSNQNNEDDKYVDSFIRDAALPVPVPVPVPVPAPSPVSCGRGEGTDENVEIHHKSEDGGSHGCELAENDSDQEKSTKTEDCKKNIPQKMEPPLEGEIVSNKDVVLGCQTLEDVALQSDVKQVLPIDNDKDQIQDQQLGPETSKNAKRKWKDKSEDDKKVTAEIANYSFTGEDKTHAPQVMQEQIQPMPSIDMEDNNAILVLSGEASSEYDREAKKIRKELMMTGTFAEVNSNNTAEDGIVKKQDFQNFDGMEEDLPVETINNEETMVDADANMVLDLLPDYQSKKGSSNKKNDQECADEMPLEAEALSSGLVIEELTKGNTNGKLAALGRKVRVHYIGMLKENGYVFVSTVGKRPYKFRLGNEEIIDGFNMGIEGMRVGDKRRLTIPPSMGYGEDGYGGIIPPNSWLVYEVELVGVRR